MQWTWTCQERMSRMKGKAYATTLSDPDSSNSDFEDSCDKEGNFLAFMTIAHVESSEDLNLLVQELGEHRIHGNSRRIRC